MCSVCASLNRAVKKPGGSERETSTARKERKGEKETRSVMRGARDGFYFGAGRYSADFANA